MIPAYRNADSPNGDFGLVKQEGDEEFVVLTVAERDALVRERDEAVKVADVAIDAAAKAVLDAKEVYEVRRLKRIEELTRDLAEAVARANTATVAANLIRAERDEAVALLREARDRLAPLPAGTPGTLGHRIDALTKARG